jgi:hypothetical protein
MLAVREHIIKAMGRQKVTALRLIDLPAAFGTIDWATPYLAVVVVVAVVTVVEVSLY